jgi:tRNA-specific 2-thiouridylase
MRVLVAMSGGVDSSVAALLLKEAGHDVVGLFLRNGVAAPEAGGRPGHQGCCSVDDARDARRVADLLGIPFYALDYADGFGRLVDYFVDSYNRGETPSPCVLCNQWLKFGSLAELARGLGAEKIATGHYARTEPRPDGRTALRRAADPAKDQTYFLGSLSQEQLARSLFPVGHLTKPEVREIARRAGLRTAEKPESMEICFVPGGDYRRLLEERAPGALRAGDVVDEAGRVLGRHAGFQSFTIGQRRGVGVALGAPAYVTEIDAARNLVRIGPRAALERRELEARDVVWGARGEPAEDEWVRCEAQVRHRARPAKASAARISGARARVVFDAPVDAIAPGQAVVLYAGDEVLAGGFIERSN